MNRGEAALPPVGGGAGSAPVAPGSHQKGRLRAHSTQCSMKSTRPGSAHPKRTRSGLARRRARRKCAGRKEFLALAWRSALEPEKGGVLEISVPPRTLGVLAPTNNVPGTAVLWSRAAVFTRSPALMPCPVAPIVTAASPLSTPALRLSFDVLICRPDTAISVTRSKGGAHGVVLMSHGRPPLAMTAPPINFSTTHPIALDHVARTIEVAAQQLSLTSLAPRLADNVVNPTRSANRTDSKRGFDSGPRGVARVEGRDDGGQK